MQDEFVYNTPYDEAADLEDKITKIVRKMDYEELVETLGLEYVEQLVIDKLCDTWSDVRHQYEEDLYGL